MTEKIKNRILDPKTSKIILNNFDYDEFIEKAIKSKLRIEEWIKDFNGIQSGYDTDGKFYINNIAIIPDIHLQRGRIITINKK